MNTPQYVALLEWEHQGNKFHGTGFAISSDGLLVTCLHVVEKLGTDANINVTFPNRGKIKYYVIENAKSSLHDIALLEPAVRLDPPLSDIGITLSQKDHHKGDKLTGYGWSNRNSFTAPQQHSVSVMGFIGESGLLGLDGHINPGDSGGPLYNSSEEIAGIIRCKDCKREGHSAAIPSKTLIRILSTNGFQSYLKRCDQSLIASVRSCNDAHNQDSVPVTRHLANKIARDIILISCSSHKASGGETHPHKFTIKDSINNSLLTNNVFETRRKIRELLQRGSVDGVEFQEGNRAARTENQKLILGPDFGGKVNGPVYLPAYQRYTGRSYQPTKSEWLNFFNQKKQERPIIIVVSGLYGLINIKEPIQNYDCHLTDKVQYDGSKENTTIAGIWKNIPSNIMSSYLDKVESDGFEPRHVIDLLSEESYQNIFDWDKINGRATVLHRKFKNKCDREALANMGIWLLNIVRDPRSLSSFAKDKYFELDEFLNNDQMMLKSHKT